MKARHGLRRQGFGPGLDVAVLVDCAAVDAPAGFAGPAEAEAVGSVDDMAKDVARALEARGHKPRIISLPGDVRGLFELMGSLDADVIQNHVEGYKDLAALESSIRGVMQLTGIPVTGATVEGLALCLDKPRARNVLSGVGLPVPRAIVATAPDDGLLGVPLPCIVKPAAQDASHGIDASSVCHTKEEAQARVNRLFAQKLGPALLEQFIDGRELNVSMIESPSGTLRVLPVAEIDYSAFPSHLPKILTYAAKWEEQSDEYKGSVSKLAALKPELERVVVDVATRAFRATGLRGYGRVDFRLDPDGTPYAIDVNPNPDLSADAGLCLAATRAGMTYEDLVETILREAIERTP